MFFVKSITRFKMMNLLCAPSGKIWHCTLISYQQLSEPVTFLETFSSSFSDHNAVFRCIFQGIRLGLGGITVIKEMGLKRSYKPCGGSGKESNQYDQSAHGDVLKRDFFFYAGLWTVRAGLKLSRADFVDSARRPFFVLYSIQIPSQRRPEW